MNHEVILRVAACLTLFSTGTLAVLPNGQCSVEEETCTLTNDNVIGMIYDVKTAEDCRKECENTSDSGCRVYSYYGPAGIPYVETCLLFSYCTTLDPCVSCYTEDFECIFCNAPVEGRLSDNQIDFVVGVTEAACEAECQIQEGCEFITYHNSNSSTYHETCFLLTELREPITYCENDTCLSGSPNCDQNFRALVRLMEAGIHKSVL